MPIFKYFRVAQYTKLKLCGIREECWEGHLCTELLRSETKGMLDSVKDGSGGENPIGTTFKDVEFKAEVQ